MDIVLSKTDSLLSWAIVNASSNLANKEGKDLLEVIPDVGKRLEVVMTINGVEVDLENTFKEMRKQDERRIEAAAKEMINEKIGELDNFIESVRRGIIEKLENDFGVKVDEDNY